MWVPGGQASICCFCPIQSVVEDTGPSIDTVLDEYQEQLEDSNVPVVVTGLKEIQVLECEAGISFNSDLVLTFFITQDTGGLLGDLQTLFNVIQETYNKLTEGPYCDPMLRRIEGLDLALMTLVETRPNGCDLYSLTIAVSGSCHGCDNGSSLFHVAGSVTSK